MTSGSHILAAGCHRRCCCPILLLGRTDASFQGALALLNARCSLCRSYIAILLREKESTETEPDKHDDAQSDDDRFQVVHIILLQLKKFRLLQIESRDSTSTSNSLMVNWQLVHGDSGIRIRGSGNQVRSVHGASNFQPQARSDALVKGVNNEYG